MYKCVAIDLDRTTLNRDSEFSSDTIQILNRLINKGIEIVIASGRSYASLPECVFRLKGIKYIVAGNGAAIYSMPEGRCIHVSKVPSKAIDSIIKRFSGNNLTFEAFIDGIPYAQQSYVDNCEQYGMAVWTAKYIRDTRRTVPDITDFIRRNKDNLDCIDIVFFDDDLFCEWKPFEKELEGIYVTSSIKNLVEISNIDSGKHFGLTYVERLLGITNEDVVAFGDGDNDADMLKHAGLGIAMGNATDFCKSASDMVTLSNDENGVAVALKKVFSEIL